MKFSDPNNPNEKKKMIVAAVLALAAIIVLVYVFFGGGSSKPPVNSNNLARSSPSPNRLAKGPDSEPSPDETIYQPIVYTGTVAAVSEADRNIFAYYEPPPKPSPEVKIPMPSPTPTPPLIASVVSPSNVYAGTPSDFSLQLTGDKFSPAVHIVIDGRDLPTRFINRQQLFTTVPASVIASAGTRQVMARSNDGKLYSNTVSLNVAPAPEPNFNYVGLIGKKRFNDVAVLQDKSSKDLISVQRGDPVGGRFRVLSISEKEVVLIDATLKIPHRLAYTYDPSSGAPVRNMPSGAEPPEGVIN